MFRSYLRFKVKPGLADEFREAFLAAGMLSRPHEIEGFLGAELFQAQGDPECFVVLGEWASPQAYSAWRAVAQTGDDREAIARLAATVLEVGAGELFRQVD